MLNQPLESSEEGDGVGEADEGGGEGQDRESTAHIEKGMLLSRQSLETREETMVTGEEDWDRGLREAGTMGDGDSSGGSGGGGEHGGRGEQGSRLGSRSGAELRWRGGDLRLRPSSGQPERRVGSAARGGTAATRRRQQQLGDGTGAVGRGVPRERRRNRLARRCRSWRRRLAGWGNGGREMSWR